VNHPEGQSEASGAEALVVGVVADTAGKEDVVAVGSLVVVAVGTDAGAVEERIAVEGFAALADAVHAVCGVAVEELVANIEMLAAARLV